MNTLQLVGADYWMLQVAPQLAYAYTCFQFLAVLIKAYSGSSYDQRLTESYRKVTASLGKDATFLRDSETC